MSVRLRLLLLVALLFPALASIPPSAVADEQPTAAPTIAQGGDTAAPVPTDPLIFSDDFEAYGDSTLWSRAHPLPVQTDVVATGKYAARLSSSGSTPAYGRKNLDGDYSRLFVRMQIQIVSAGSQPVTLLQLRKSSRAWVASIQMDADGYLSYVTDPGGIPEASTAKLQPGEWYDLQVMLDVGSPDATLRIWLNGAEMTSLPQEVWFGDATVRLLQLGDNSVAREFDVAFDDVRVDDEFIAASRKADPVPGTILVRTAPVLPGAEFSLEGKTFVADEYGLARIQVDRWSTDLRARITVHDSPRSDGSVAAFTYWINWLGAHSREVVASYEILDPVNITFADMQGHPVNSSIIDLVVIKSSTGDIHKFTAADLERPVLLTVRVTNTPTGIKNKPILYYLDEVIIDGANVVNRSQQRATFDRSKSWQISLLFYSVRFRAADAFFGTPIGTDVLIESADGTQMVLPLDGNGETFIPRLPRGEYSVSVLGAGYSPPRPVMVSRDQIIDLEVISALDVSLVAGLAALSAVMLLVIGRPFLILWPVGQIRALTRRWGAVRPPRLSP